MAAKVEESRSDKYKRRILELLTQRKCGVGDGGQWNGTTNIVVEVEWHGSIAG